MNGYNLIRNWYNFKFANPSKTKAAHSDMYCYLVDQWNRLGQKKEFGLPTLITMEALGIGSYNTYKKTLDDLIEFGFVSIVKDSRNQHQSKVIALSKYDEAIDKALDKATIKATDKPTDKPTDTIIKQKNKEQVNKETKELLFENFWNLYAKKSGRDACLKKWMKLDIPTMEKIIQVVPAYVLSTPDIQYRKLPLTYLNGKHWEDEIITSSNPFVLSQDINDIDHPKHFVVNRFDVEWKLEKGIFYMDGKTVQNREFFMKFYNYEKEQYEKLHS